MLSLTDNFEFEVHSDKVKKKIEYCLNMTAEEPVLSYAQIVNKLKNTNAIKPSRETTNLRPSDSKSIDRRVTDLCSQLIQIKSDIQTLVQCSLEITNKIRELQDRIKNQETSCVNEKIDDLFQQQTAIVNKHNAVADMVQHSQSEEIREKRKKQVVITHPTININSDQIHQQVMKIFTEVLFMEPKNIDTAFQTTKMKRENTVIVSFSHVMFKKFMFVARKQVRENDINKTNGLFINDNLTSYNYNLLKGLKEERKTRSEENKPNFKYIFTIDGRVFVRESDDGYPKHISSKEELRKFLSSLEA